MISMELPLLILAKGPAHQTAVQEMSYGCLALGIKLEKSVFLTKINTLSRELISSQFSSILTEIDPILNMTLNPH